MKSRITELSCKEVINICDGTRYGYVNDVEVDIACGRIISLVIHTSKFASVFLDCGDIIIPWESIKRIGDDLILVDNIIEPPCRNKKNGFFKKSS